LSCLDDLRLTSTVTGRIVDCPYLLGIRQSSDQRKGVNLRVLDHSIDTGTSRALFGMTAVIAEFDRDLIEERRVEGMRKYHARLKKEGRKPRPEKRIDSARATALRDEGKLIREIGASKASVSRALRDA
jgi:DNA invertase Pin-like site-specific DNA recombinase